MERIDTLIESIKLPNETTYNGYEVLRHSPDELLKIKDSKSYHCGIGQLEKIFSWKKCFSYLFTGTPNTGKTTLSMYMLLIMALKNNWRIGVWTQEMEDAYLVNKKAKYHVKDMMNLLAWTLITKTPFRGYSEKYGTIMAEEKELIEAYQIINNHFEFYHLKDRTPSGIMRAFGDSFDKKPIDFFIIDPWKSVKQIIDTRSDIWLEDVLMTFKEFTLETNSGIVFVVHPKTMKDYRDPKDDSNYRIVTQFDLNGGAAWNNSMDVIVSLRNLILGDKKRMEFHSLKIRKQHIVGKPGMEEGIEFDMHRYRYYFGITRNDPMAQILHN